MALIFPKNGFKKKDYPIKARRAEGNPVKAPFVPKIRKHLFAVDG
jgi:hypothetical protein